MQVGTRPDRLQEEDLQADLDVWLKEFNFERTRQDKHCFGRTPWRTFLDGGEL
jgi:hypothetical protein